MILSYVLVSLSSAKSNEILEFALNSYHFATMRRVF